MVECLFVDIWYETKKNDKFLRDILTEFLLDLKKENVNYKLKSKGTRDACIEEVLIHLQHEEIKFNENPYILHFENGIIDLKTGLLRDTRPEENIFLTTGYSFKRTGTEKALEFLRKMFKRPEELKCFINILSQSLEGLNRNNKIYFLIGESESNGKSTICEITMDVHGKLGYRIATNILTGTRESAECGNPAIKNFMNKRFAYCSEPEARKQININIVVARSERWLTVRNVCNGRSTTNSVMNTRKN